MHGRSTLNRSIIQAENYLQSWQDMPQTLMPSPLNWASVYLTLRHSSSTSWSRLEQDAVALYRHIVASRLSHCFKYGRETGATFELLVKADASQKNFAEGGVEICFGGLNPQLSVSVSARPNVADITVVCIRECLIVALCVFPCSLWWHHNL